MLHLSPEEIEKRNNKSKNKRKGSKKSIKKKDKEEGDQKLKNEKPVKDHKDKHTDKNNKKKKNNNAANLHFGNSKAASDNLRMQQKQLEISAKDQQEEGFRHPGERRGDLVCNGSKVDSEVIYWRVVPGDAQYESPITPHHAAHDDKYITFEYDAGGWNNVRMGMECLLVVAHATGRTLVVPPQQHLYLLGQNHKDAEDAKAHDEMGFEDFFDLNLLSSHQGLHIMHMEDFLAKEGVTGGLKGQLPPKNSSQAWGGALWSYLKRVADAKPLWRGVYVSFPSHPGNFDFEHAKKDSKLTARMKAFGGDRGPVFYNSELQQAHHIHFPAEPSYRILQHHYAFAFFEDAGMQKYYRRLVRDYMRYKDSIQCAGHDLLQWVRQEALAIAPQFGGEFYALHIRRGDLQFKDVKISATEIVKNLHFPNGTAMIPRGAMVYISTDDPDGICRGCMVLRKSCNKYSSPKPVGCPEDPSWKAFIKAGWQIRFMRDFQRRGALQGVNPNVLGMVESIVCSRAYLFAGTYFSTFTGYIHRLRGYHGRGEMTFYHSHKYKMNLQMKLSVGHGFSREWRAGWTDDEGAPI